VKSLTSAWFHFQTLEPTLAVWLIYCVILCLVFIFIKIFNYKLHHMFDTCEVIEEVEDKATKQDGSTPAVEVWYG